MKVQKLYCIWLFQTLLVSKFTFGGFERTNSKHREKERERRGKRLCFERYCTNEHFNSNTKEQFLFRNPFQSRNFHTNKVTNWHSSNLFYNSSITRLYFFFFLKSRDLWYFGTSCSSNNAVVGCLIISNISLKYGWFLPGFFIALSAQAVTETVQ